MDDRVNDLIQRDIDGDLSARERQELMRVLSSEPSAHELHKELTHVNEILSQVPELEPPADVNAAVLDQVGHPPAAAPRAAIRPPAQGVWRLGYLVAAGVVMGLAIGLWVGQRLGTVPEPDVSGLFGTMGGSAGVPGLLVTGEGVTGSIDLKRVSDGWVVAMGLDLAGPSEVEMEFDPEVLGLQGMVHSDGDLDVAAQAGRIGWSIEPGGKGPILRFLERSAAETTIRVTISSAGQIVYQDLLRVPAVGAEAT